MIQDLSGSLRIKGTGESTLVMDSPVTECFCICFCFFVFLFVCLFVCLFFWSRRFAAMLEGDGTLRIKYFLILFVGFQLLPL